MYTKIQKHYENVHQKLKIYVQLTKLYLNH